MKNVSLEPKGLSSNPALPLSCVTPLFSVCKAPAAPRLVAGGREARPASSLSRAWDAEGRGANHDGLCVYLFFSYSHVLVSLNV